MYDFINKTKFREKVKVCTYFSYIFCKIESMQCSSTKGFIRLALLRIFSDKINSKIEIHFQIGKYILCIHLKYHFVKNLHKLFPATVNPVRQSVIT